MPAFTLREQFVMLEVNVFDIAVNVFWVNWLHLIHGMCAFARVLDVKVCVCGFGQPSLCITFESIGPSL